MPSGDGFARLSQTIDPALLEEKFPDLTAERIVRPLGLCCFEHLAENADEFFFDFAVSLL